MAEPTAAEIQERVDYLKSLAGWGSEEISIAENVMQSLLAENKRLRELVGKEAMRCTDPLNIEIPQYMCCNKHPWVLMTDKMGANLECPMCRAEAAEADYLESCRLHKETSRMLIDQQNRRKAAEAAIARVEVLPKYNLKGQRVLYGRSSKDAQTGEVSELFVKATELQAALERE